MLQTIAYSAAIVDKHWAILGRNSNLSISTAAVTGLRLAGGSPEYDPWRVHHFCAWLEAADTMDFVRGAGIYLGVLSGRIPSEAVLWLPHASNQGGHMISVTGPFMSPYGLVIYVPEVIGAGATTFYLRGGAIYEHL